MPLTCSSVAAALSPSTCTCDPVAFNDRAANDVSTHFAHFRYFAWPDSAAIFNFAAGCTYQIRTRTVFGNPDASVAFRVCALLAHTIIDIVSRIATRLIGLHHVQWRMPQKVLLRHQRHLSDRVLSRRIQPALFRA